MEKSLFRAHPEFERGHEVRATVIAPGQMLISVSDDRCASDDDPILDAFLAFLASDIERRPEHLHLLSTGSIAKAVALTDGISVDDREVFPGDMVI